MSLAVPSAQRLIFETLRGRFDAEGWWPAASTFEMMVGAILVQNTAWRNVETSIRALRERALLDPVALAAIPAEELAEVIRPSGFMTAKSRSAVALARWVVETDSLNGGVSSRTDAELREELLALPGIGPETADVIGLYAFDRPAFIWDTYARRMLTAVGYSVPGSYPAARRALTATVEAAGFSVSEYREFHGLIVEAGKHARSLGGWDVLAAELFPAR
ncbi:endonuclease-3 related protein [Mycetocola sp. BIGb0189]|uniref:endonuclease III domain-containing protein n=1 Tax=Mycetocola sp. BIGb0189 TaxID=2940604 RepID=UPI002167E02A|nr:endonuclease III [Mycetocola sp. BIGb0189]MCS4275383.1 endonuclease-3 related protein [Mycetocola sp. BIGb0189]